MKVGDESMSTICFCTTSNGNLTHLSYIFHKKKQPGIEFKNFACTATGAFLFIDIHRGDYIKNSRKYDMKIGETSVCKKRIMEETKGIRQRYIKGGRRIVFFLTVGSTQGS